MPKLPVAKYAPVKVRLAGTPVSQKASTAQNQKDAPVIKEAREGVVVENQEETKTLTTLPTIAPVTTPIIQVTAKNPRNKR